MSDITIPPLDTLHTPVTAFEQTMLKEFLNEDESLVDTIDNLEQLFNHDNVGNVLSRKVAFHARRTLVSLKILAATIEGTS